ncbi:MAG: serine/threonine protein kinase [Acidobacteria bacterium]|jgi:serine/threonine-protein kinase|nr:serine/threonine protein kinase [Acidobacteriota bacterium]
MALDNRLIIIIAIIVLSVIIIVLKMQLNPNKKKKTKCKKKIPVFKGPNPVIGNYKKVAQIATGGMSTIYWAKATHGDKKDVVLKVLENVKKENKQVGEKFLEEGKIIKRINEKDPSAPVVKVIEYSQDKTTGLYFIAIEYLDGVSLKNILDRKSELSLKEKLLIVKDVARALKFCHEFKICHCDIIPGNIIVHQNKKNATLIDFSIALNELPAKASGVGTPSYISPEQGKKGAEITAKSDIYSLGVVLFHLVEGTPPHKVGKYANITDMQKTDAKIPKVTKPVPTELKNFIEKMMSLKPGERPDAQVVIDSLTAFIKKIG